MNNHSKAFFQMHRKYYFILLMLVALPVKSNCATFSPIRILEDGKLNACIIIAPDASKRVMYAARTLQEYIQKASETEIDIKNPADLPEDDNSIHLWIGPSDLSRDFDSDLRRMDKDGFIISFPSSKDIIIVGSTDWGTEYGVYEFLETYLGVRWLMPGPAGEHVPMMNTIDIPTNEIRQEPVFSSRQLSGLRGPFQMKWGRFNRMRNKVKFHHNLFNLIQPSRYTQTHPEFFPLQKKHFKLTGKRSLPEDFKSNKWQPCFTAPGIVDEAVKNICAYFEKHPKATSYSLGVNDEHGYCECDSCMAKYSGRRNYLGRRDYSDVYFGWANAVVEGVLKRYPDKTFGCLAFNEIAEPPGRVKIHPRIIPFLTYDRIKWCDPAIEREDRKITEQWNQKTSQLGWYDYLYGTPYMLPRVYFHRMADSYRFAAEHGVNSIYAEAYPNWGEGPKYYLALKLFWNPNQDVQTLLNEWYTKAVGEIAAPYLASYFNLWENYWTERITQSPWFNNGKFYLNFRSPEYMDLVTFDDIEKSRKLLETVLKYTHTDQERRRAKYLLRSFEYYEASTLSYLGLKRKMVQSGKSIKYYEAMNKRRYSLVNEFQKNSILMHPCRFDNPWRFEKLQW
jgi:hypothetical protein